MMSLVLTEVASALPRRANALLVASCVVGASLVWTPPLPILRFCCSIALLLRPSALASPCLALAVLVESCVVGALLRCVWFGPFGGPANAGAAASEASTATVERKAVLFMFGSPLQDLPRLHHCAGRGLTTTRAAARARCDLRHTSSSFLHFFCAISRTRRISANAICAERRIARAHMQTAEDFSAAVRDQAMLMRDGCSARARWNSPRGRWRRRIRG